MGQLIKLEDYVSRYEQNIYHYPSRFVRLKKQQWENLKENLGNEQKETPDQGFWYEDEKTPIINRLKGLFQKRNQEVETKPVHGYTLAPEEKKDEEEMPFQFTAQFSGRSMNEEEMKIQFLDQLFRFQLKWATSTIAEKSHMNSQYFYDEKLKFFVQRFPDNFLVLYHPIFLLKSAPTESEIILISPTDTWCITFLEAEENAVFQGSNEHFWIKRIQHQEKKVLNPLIALNRTGTIIQKIYQLNEIELPIHKIVLSRNGYIDFPHAPSDVRFYEKRNFEEWFQAMRRLKSPLKHIQLKSAGALLQYCQTTSYRRPEWDLLDDEQKGES
ncbi:NERD domain-containing protein [Bacillus sp. CGMCC 1.16607]|uniref:NERD domain-containing protein n=1 Tax=Bacillus sp. CGMCC 1.16607 TaxID=3351842 RepID=UPI0036407E95